MPNASPAGPLVAVLAYDRPCTFEFGVAYEVFGLPRPELGPGWYRYTLARAEDGPLCAEGGLVVAADCGLEALAEADLVVVPGWRGVDAPVPTALVDALRAASARGARLASLCSGVFVLAATGLLDHRRATTHWRYVEALRVRHPAITVEPDVLYVDNGDILTAAGSAAGIDLCLHVVRRDYGPEAANKVARRLVVPPHRDGGQAQYVERPVPRAWEEERFGGVVAWMRRNLDRDQTLADLAARAGMSRRTFQRRFQEATGAAPGQWLARERVNRAAVLLDSGYAPTLEAVATACGFGSAAILRHHFQRAKGTTPRAYRARFGPVGA